ncbi:MAG: TonB-dependent receptor [Acidobacteria bacterium]|mgnify:CR=1 FL=1|nr:TonB-dependent receptor [Acidobacteriota bacterium]
MTRCRALVALIALALLCAPSAMAQEQRGAIEGTVKDSSGGVLPGVTVEAKNIAVGSVATTVTDAVGAYRFPALAPGRYEVTASLTGFNAQKFESIEVLLGQIKTADFTLGLAGLSETVQVSAESPLVDVRQSARSTSIRDEQIDMLPKGRDFTSVVTQAAGANTESKLGGLSIDGASASENRYIVDGVETTNLQNGTSGKDLIVDFLEEVQVKSSGYTAEYGGATGGVVNAMTKSGTNSFHGNLFGYFEGDAMEGGRRPTLRTNPNDSRQAEYVTYPEDSWTRLDPGASLGGPIMQNRMWFFGAYQPRVTTTERQVSPKTAANPAANTFNQEQKVRGHNISANTTGQWGNSLRTRIAYNNSWRKTEGQLPGLTGTNAADTNFGIDTTYPNWSLAGTADWIVRSNFFVGFRAGYYFSDRFNDGVPSVDRYRYSYSNIGMPGVPEQYQHGSLYSNVFTNNSTTRDQQTRLNFQLDSTYYANFGGQHTFKGGVQVDRVGNNVLEGELGNFVTIRWDSDLSGQRGTYGYYSVRSNGTYPEMGFVTEGDVHTTNIGLFIQDAWTVNNKLTLNLGLRTERERVPAYVKGAGYPEYAVEFNFADKLAPRLGFAYDIKGDGKWKAFGSWGVFYDIFKLQLPRGSFGGDKWLEYYYTLDNPNPEALAAGSSCPPDCEGTLIRGPIDFRHVSLGSDAIDPDLKPMKMQEASFGLEHQLSNLLAVSVRYVHKQLDRAIEDVGALDADQNEIYIVANPGYGLASKTYDLDLNVYPIPYPKAKRDYDAVEFAISKNFSDNWYLRASYMWSRLYGNYSGLSQSDEDGRTDPNVGRAFDYPIMMFNQHGEAEYGPLATDRPHQFKAQFIYQLPFGTSVGLNQYVASGVPITPEITVIPPNNFPVQWMGRGGGGRMPVYSYTDLSLRHAFNVGGSRQIQLMADVFNLFNQKTATSKESSMPYDQGVTFNEADFYAGRVDFNALIANLDKSATYLMDETYQSPISARIGVKFTF